MLFFFKEPKLDRRTQIILLFGTGLIGTSICNKINKNAEYSLSFFPFNWNKPNQIKKDAETIYDYLTDVLTSYSKNRLRSCDIAFIWCAGKAGFSASKENITDELADYDIVLDIVEQLTADYPAVSIFFHLMSSAGGLFEGQHLAVNHTIPVPKRYYGRLKLEQEKRLIKFGCKVATVVYRPTSVYGFVGPHQRMGLVPTLITNGIKNKISTIYGELSTLRDYVFNDDIGCFIARNLFPAKSSGDMTVHFLGSGKPSSIHEIKHLVEQAIGKKIFLEFRHTPYTENTKDTTFNSSILPADWTPVDIKTGIRSVKERILAETTITLPASH